MRQELIDAIVKDGIIQAKVGEVFTLSSGQKSTYYIDCRRVSLNADGLRIMTDNLMGMLYGLSFDAVGGPAIAAIPLVTAVMQRIGCNGFIVRQTQKDHGLQQQIEGPPVLGSRVVILEDVATSGGSILKTIKAVEAAGAIVVGVRVILDRLAGAAEALAGYDYKPVLTMNDFNCCV